MRILAIRGRNLASLAGEFSVDLERPPLKDAGVFAITGPTGAGKTSLLDALCVALFDRTPRLHTRGGVLIGREEELESERLSSTDVRTLLRRGAGSGHAEVEFLGRDGHRYRARWSVRRARNKADGRFQASTMELYDEDAERALGGTKSETLAAIQDRLGLSFHQFTRSALLAQGEFAAFLQANARERAELLERMTGTQIYGALSIAAHRRAGDEARSLGALVEQLGKVAVLDDEMRQRLTERLAEVGAQVAAERARVDAARRATEAGAAMLRARIDLDRQRDIAIRAEIAESVAGKASDAAARGHAAAEAALVAARPQLDRAAELDGQIAQAGEAALAARGEAGAAAAAASEAAERGAQLAESVEQSRRAGAAAAQWLDEHAGLAPIAADWALVRKELAAFGEATAAVAALDARRVEEADAFEAAQLAARGAGKAEAAAKRKLAAATRKVDGAEAAAVELPADALREQVEQLDARREALQELAAAADNAAALGERIRKLDKARAAAKAAAAQAAKRAAKAETEREKLEARVEEAEAAWHQASQALSFEEHRAELVDGEPCPLCGSEDHPYADDGKAVGRLVRAQKQRVTEVRAQLTAAAKREASARTRAEEQAEVAAQAARDAREQRAELDEIAAWWADAAAEPTVAALELPEAIDGAAVGAHLEATDGEREAVRKQQVEADKRARALARARAAADETREAWLAAKQAHTEADRAVHAAGETARATEAALAAERRRVVRARETLAPLFGDDVPQLAAIQPAIEAWNARTAERARAEARTAELAAAHDKAVAVAAERREAAEAAAARAAGRDAALAVLRAERGELLGGEPTVAARDRLEGAVRDAAAAVEAARAKREAAVLQRATATARAEETRNQLAEHDEARRRAIAELGADAPKLAALAAALETLEQTHRELLIKLRLDEQARAAAGELQTQIDGQRRTAELWGALAELIGSSDGKKFRVFAQSLTLDALLGHANRHLDELAPRYRLQRVPGYDLDLQVIDRDLGDEVRSVNSLSGGESFLVSLALALGLSSVSARDTQVESLLIDEGFGTLDPDTLEVALATLDTLQASGRKVGLISHVPGLAERIGVQVQVTPRGSGRSTVSVVAG